MEVRLYQLGLAVENRHDEMEFIANIDHIKMYKDIDFGGFIVVDGKSYRHCSYDIKKDILCVEPVELNEDAGEIEYDEFTCPYCGNVDDDAFELSDFGETECSACGSDLEYERVVTVEYNVVTVEYNVAPVKCAPITRI